VSNINLTSFLNGIYFEDNLQWVKFYYEMLLDYQKTKKNKEDDEM
jgi:hypothetical protein